VAFVFRSALILPNKTEIPSTPPEEGVMLEQGQLAELASHVLAAMPSEATAPSLDDPARVQSVRIERRDGDRFVARWHEQPPMPGTLVELHVSQQQSVYVLSATVSGLADGTAGRLLTITELRRRRQRRTAPRAKTDELVVVSHEGDVDAELVDVSGTGVGFALDRSLPTGAQIRAVLNFGGTVIPTVAIVRQVKHLAHQHYRIGCEFIEISSQHRHLLSRYAADNPIDRRAGTHPSTLTDRLSRYRPHTRG
jgi:PilZ domain